MSPHKGGVTTEGGHAAVSFYISLFCVKKKKKKTVMMEILRHWPIYSQGLKVKRLLLRY